MSGPAFHDDAQPEPGAAPTRAVRMRWDDVLVEGATVRVPERSLTTAEIEDRIKPLYRKLGFKPGWVEAVTGIQARRLWPVGTSYLDGAVQAARAAMAEAGVRPDEVQALVSCSVYRHRLEPSLACEIQGELGIGSWCLNHDVSNACLGFLTGLSQVANMIALRQIEVGLVVASEDAGPVLEATIERLCAADADIHAFKANLATLTLGSCAAAVVLTSKRRARRAHQLLGMTTLSATEHHGLCEGDAGGMITDSVRLLREGVSLAGRTWAEFTDLVGWSVGDVRAAAMHQVGKAHHDTIVRHLGLPPDRAPQVYPWLGNIGSCGVPATTFLARDQARFGDGDRVALLGIGSGLNCAMMAMRW
jgi:3-oxoacyl-[acyl-carrier-protein] synthase-3